MDNMTSKAFSVLLAVYPILMYGKFESVSGSRPDISLSNTSVSTNIAGILPELTFGAITPSALLQMASVNETLRELLSASEMPPGLTMLDVNMCMSYNTTEQKCVYDRLKLFLSTSNWPFLNSDQKGSRFPVCSLGYGDSGCGSVKYLTSECGTIVYNKTEATDEYKIFYGKEKVRCEWVIKLDKGHRILLNFKYMNLRYCGDACTCDSLQIYELINGTERKHVFCGTRTPWSMTTSTNEIIIRFKLVGYLQGTGIKLEYETVDDDDLILSSPPHVFTGENGSIIVPSLTPSKIENGQYIYECQIRVEENRRINFTWQFNSSCPSDTYFTVYDGPVNVGKRNYIVPKTSRNKGMNVSTGFQTSLILSLPLTCTLHFLDYSYRMTKSVRMEANVSYMNITTIDLSNNDSTYVKLSLETLTLPALIYYQFTAPVGSYVAMNITEFDFKGPNINDCENEGLVIWDGIGTSNIMYGPFCGTHYHTQFFSSAYRKWDTQKFSHDPVIHSSTNSIKILFYSYGSDTGTSFSFNTSVSSCRGVFDWTQLDKIDGLEANYTVESNGKIDVAVVLKRNVCFQLQSLPSNEPCDNIINVRILYSDAYIATTYEVISRAWVSDCSAYTDVRNYDLETKIYKTCKCHVTAIGYTARIAKIKKNFGTCDENTVFGEYKENIQVKSTICGSLYLKEPTEHRILLMGPFGLYKNYYYSIIFTCMDFIPCYPVRSKLSLSEKAYPGSVYFTQKEIQLDTMPFRYDTAWSYYVSITLKFVSPYVSMQLHYSMKENPEPKAHLIEKACSENGTTDTFLFEKSCYLFIVNSEEPIKTWVEANDACQREGGSLVTINSKEEYLFIKGMLKRKWMQRKKRIIYIGLLNTAKGFSWIDESPAVITDWYRPVATELQFLPTNFFGNNINFASSTLIQPTNDPSCNCAAMAVLSPSMSTNWIRIPCQFPYPGSAFICEYPKLQGDQEESMILKPSESINETMATLDPIKTIKVSIEYERNITKLVPGRIKCPNGWTYMQNRCYKMLNSQGPIDRDISCLDAAQMCAEFGGQMAETNEQNLRELLKIWLILPEYGDVWLSNCSVLAYVNNKNKWRISAHNKEKALSHVINVICEIDKVSIEHGCLDDQFTCNDGTCILGFHQCDNKQDCLEGEDELNCTCTDDDFKCEVGQCIPYSKYCDFQQDCSDNSDEVNCTFTHCPPGYSKCDNGECLENHRFGDYVFDCMDRSDEKKKILRNSTCETFRCYSGDCLPVAFYQNLRADCVGQAQEDEALEPLDVKRGEWYTSSWSLAKNTKPFCPAGNGTLTRCRLDHVLCFERHRACILDEDKYGFMESCPDGDHLRDCSSYECPNMFKCPKSYCIPYHKVCDGKRDCIDGHDEMSCKNLSCPGLFKCRKEGICLDQSLVCDGIVHCKHSFDDEAVCSHRKCPTGCSCKDRLIRCTNIKTENLLNLSLDTRSLELTGYSNLSAQISFQYLIYLGKLHLRGMGIRTIETGLFAFLENLLLLDLRNNLLTSLKKGMFSGLKNLQHLLLTGNPIQTLSRGSFHGLLSLTYLRLDNLQINSVADDSFTGIPSVRVVSLTNNSLSKMSPLTWNGLSNLKTLNLKGNVIKDFALDTFENLKLMELHTDFFKFCCFAKRVEKCTPSGDEFSSCEDLMANQILQIAIWVLGVAAIVGNVAVIIGRLAIKGKDMASLMIVNLSISDLLMGVYLLIIAAADTQYRGTYIMHADQWRASWMCKLAGFLSTLSSEMSVFMLVVITADRLLTLVFPFSSKKMSLRRGMLIMASGWCVIVLLSAFPVMNLSYFGDNYIRNGVCLLFNIAAGKTQGWEYATFLFLLFNLIAFLFIFCSYILIYHTLHKARKNANRDVSEADFELAQRFVLIVTTDFICWVPLIATAFLSLGGVPINPGVSAWMAVLILPLNSALNPYLYTFAMLRQMKKQKAKKKKSQKTTSSAISNSSGKRAPPGKASSVVERDNSIIVQTKI